MRIFNFLLLSFTLLLPAYCLPQTTGDYQTNSDWMDWSSTEGWQTWDTLTSSWIATTQPPELSAQKIHIRKDHTVIIKNDLETDQLIISGTLKNEASAFTLHNGSGDDLTIENEGKFINNGSFKNDSAIVNNNGQFINNTNSIVINNGQFINNINSIVINSGDFIGNGKIDFEDRSHYYHLFPSTEAKTGIIPAATWKQGAVCEIIACGSNFQPSGLNQTFHHFIWNNATQPHDFNLVSKPSIVKGNFEIKNTNKYQLTYKKSSTDNLNIADTFKITGGKFVLTNGQSSTTVTAKNYFQSAGTLDISSSSTPCSLRIQENFEHLGGIIQASGRAANNLIRIESASPSSLESIGFRENDTLHFEISKAGITGNCSIPKQFIIHEGTRFILTDNPDITTDLQVSGILNFGLNSIYNPDKNATFQLQPDGTLITQHPLGIDSAGVKGCLQTGKQQLSAKGVYVYNGNKKQETGSGLPDTISGKLIINNTSTLMANGVTLTKPVHIQGSLSLTQGKLRAPQLLIIEDTAHIEPIGGSAVSFVEGNIKKIGSVSLEEFIFPCGQKDKWARFGIQSKSTSRNEYTVSYISESPLIVSENKMEPIIHRISSREYWTLQTTANDSVNVRLFWESGAYSGIHSLMTDDLEITRYDFNTKIWKHENKKRVCNGTVSTGNILCSLQPQTHNLLTFGGTTGTNPLPVTLTSFSGYTTNKNNVLNWSTASEKNNLLFEIQRSENGLHFTSIGSLPGHGTTITPHFYSFTDSLFNCTDCYYRLKQIDTDGNTTYSFIIHIPFNVTAEDTELFIFPNPSPTSDIHILTDNKIQIVTIYNQQGQKITEFNTTHNRNEYTITLPVKGIYFLQATTILGKKITRKIIAVY